MYIKNNIVEKVLKGVVDIFFPRICPFCGKIISSQERMCISCSSKIVYIREPRCKKCSKPLKSNERELCFDCMKYRHNFEYGFALWQCDDLVKKAIYRYKFGNQRYFAEFFGKEIVRLYGDEIRKINPDAIIPVPLHKSRERKRGFNQSEKIAKVIGNDLNIPVFEKIVVRKKKTLSQKQLNHKQRINNVKNAFILDDNDVKLSKIVIVDDVYTTGFTIDSVAKCFLQKDDKNQKNADDECKIYFLTIGIGEGL